MKQTKFNTVAQALRTCRENGFKHVTFVYLAKTYFATSFTPKKEIQDQADKFAKNASRLKKAYERNYGKDGEPAPLPVTDEFFKRKKSNPDTTPKDEIKKCLAYNGHQKAEGMYFPYATSDPFLSMWQSLQEPRISGAVNSYGKIRRTHELPIPSVKVDQQQIPGEAPKQISGESPKQIETSSEIKNFKEAGSQLFDDKAIRCIKKARNKISNLPKEDHESALSEIPDEVISDEATGEIKLMYFGIEAAIPPADVFHNDIRDSFQYCTSIREWIDDIIVTSIRAALQEILYRWYTKNISSEVLDEKSSLRWWRHIDNLWGKAHWAKLNNIIDQL